MVDGNTKKTLKKSSMQPAKSVLYPKAQNHTIQTNQASPPPSKRNLPSVNLPQKWERERPCNLRKSSSFPDRLSKEEKNTDQFYPCRRDRYKSPDSTTGPSFLTEDDTSEKVIHESSSTSIRKIRIDMRKNHEALAGPDPEPMNEDQTGSDSGKLHVSLAGPNPEHMDDEFLATAYPKVHENLKLITGETCPSMITQKSFWFYEKSKVREESDSTIPDSSHQTVTSTPPVIVPFTEVSSSKPFIYWSLSHSNGSYNITTSLHESSINRPLVRVAKIGARGYTSADLIKKYLCVPGQSLSRLKNLKKSMKELSKTNGHMMRSNNKIQHTHQGLQHDQTRVGLQRKEGSDFAFLGQLNLLPNDDDTMSKKPKGV
ncbi:hypothetical protein Tco_0262518 [Tanacetum coccineum]